ILDENKLPPDLAGSVVIIRAHGISPAAEAELVKRGARIADATCPKVKANQLKARSLFEAGYELFLAGEARHAEIIGILGYAPCRTVGGPEEAACAGAALFKEKPRARAALLGQTTISPGEYQAIAAAVKVFFPALEVIDTVCGAARDRQRSLRELCARAEIIIAAGGRDSANTRRLLAIARESGREAYQAESAADLPVEELRRHTTAGLCAGASTPDSVIAGIEEKLRSL
ncbi:MAG: 4-hydroxy-3-methylbut-2-enyl diphosphate reductase, partial [Treponema sp.]|nr:4-hydroxy-3-methylbut-2-enyl diphosphate reductase [Treponema sp.]